MSKAKKTISNPEELIERFGGIRPMAKKMGTAVTTVQGWKKRNAIPSNRVDEIIKAGEKYDVKVEDLVASNTSTAPSKSKKSAPKKAVSKTAAKSAPKSKTKASKSSAPRVSSAKMNTASTSKTTQPRRETMNNATKQQATASSSAKPAAVSAPARTSTNNPSHDEIMKMVKETEKLNKQQSVWIAIALIVLTIVAGSFLLAPSASETRAVINDVAATTEKNQAEIEYIKQDQSLLKNLIPADWEQRVNALKQEVEQTREVVQTAASQAQNLSNNVLGEGAGSLEDRLAALEVQVQDAFGSASLAGLVQRVQSMASQSGGQQRLDQIVAQLNDLVQNTGSNSDNLNAALAEKVQSNPAMAQTFEGVAQEDMKAAAVLFGLNQFRAALNRDNQPFAGDLQLVTNLVASDNPEFAARLQALSPHAQSGVLTVEGLGKEFRSLAGDVVVASLKGEDAAVQDRAQARLNELFSVQKQGEMVTGTDTQATLARSQKLIEDGALEAAVAELQTLQGAEAQAVQPFITKAQATLAAQKVKTMLAGTINATAFGRSAAGAGITASGATGMGQYLKDEKTGLVIYTP